MIEPAEAAQCPNCGSTAEPEQEDDVLFFACECGHFFGYSRVKQEDTCAAGIPLAELVLDSSQPYGTRTGPVSVTIGRRPEAN